jgi:hypothetical protein
MKTHVSPWNKATYVSLLRPHIRVFRKQVSRIDAIALRGWGTPSIQVLMAVDAEVRRSQICFENSIAVKTQGSLLHRKNRRLCQHQVVSYLQILK